MNSKAVQLFQNSPEPKIVYRSSSNVTNQFVYPHVLFNAPYSYMCIKQPRVDQKIDRNASYSRQVASLVSRNKEYCLKAQINKFIESCDLK